MPHTGVNKDKDGNRMAKCKTPPTTPGEQIAQQILNNYDIKSAEDVQDVLKQIFGPIFESMLKGEMENHLGHKKHERSEDGDNVRNGYSSKTLKTSLGEVPIRVPRIARVRLNRRSSRSTSATFRPSRARYWRCMPVA